MASFEAIHVEAQILPEFALSSCLEVLPRLQLASWELPETLMALGCGALADEEAVVTLKDAGDHNNRGLGQLGSGELRGGDSSASKVVGEDITAP